MIFHFRFLLLLGGIFILAIHLGPISLISVSFFFVILLLLLVTTDSLLMGPE